MALKIRLRQQGRTNRPFYRVVVANSRSPRDGRYVENIGWYNPFEQEIERSLSLNEERIQHWLNMGAQMTETMVPLVGRMFPNILKQLTQKRVQRRTKALAKDKARRQKAT